eukprot:TRINITY_DN32282_c0_g1_i1.p1 TRINITY_DN32282_c0_g1~~TRINITY_DN32282_c0_g1_i1.p1  ORF type:complete len:286 (+),score=36.32 TRINITY_DN32282_c0_g1_i1:97-954(+)
MAAASVRRRVGAVLTPLAGGAALEAYRRAHMVEKEAAPRCASSLAQGILQAEHIRKLERDGIVVLGEQDAVIPSSVLSASRREIEGYFAQGRFSRRANGDSAAVRQDLVCWLSESDGFLGEGMLHCAKLLRGLAHVLEGHGYSCSWNHQVARLLQLSFYPGDGVSGYVKHFDHCDSPITHLGLLGWLQAADLRARRVTAILYLNDPDWKPSSRPRSEADPGDGDGGELRCYCPHEAGEAGERSVGHLDIIPQGGVLVLFDSRRIEHQVLSSRRDRFALTCWITGE